MKRALTRPSEIHLKQHMKNHVQSPFTGIPQTQPAFRDVADFALFIALLLVDVGLIKYFAESFTEAMILLVLAIINISFFTNAAVRIRGGGL